MPTGTRGGETAPNRTGDSAGAMSLLKTLLVNGETHALEAATLAQVLDALDYGDAKVATALNGEFVPARAREKAFVRDGDRIEIVAPRQGG